MEPRGPFRHWIRMGKRVGVRTYYGGEPVTVVANATRIPKLKNEENEGWAAGAKDHTSYGSRGNLLLRRL